MIKTWSQAIGVAPSLQKYWDILKREALKNFKIGLPNEEPGSSFALTELALLSLQVQTESLKQELALLRRSLEGLQTPLSDETWQFLGDVFIGEVAAKQFRSSSGRLASIPSDMIEAFIHNRPLNGRFIATEPGCIYFVTGNHVRYWTPLSLIDFLDSSRLAPVPSHPISTTGMESGMAYEGTPE